MSSYAQKNNGHGHRHMHVIRRMCSTLHLAFLSLYFSHQAFASGPTDGMCAYAVPVQGYTCKEYTATTDDGYILSVQRISGASQGNDEHRQPVLLQHGLFADGKCWLENSPQQSLALILADNGFDVWISNFRGTRYSRRHVSRDPADPAFWDWTWNELANHDVPAVIDLIVKETGQQIHYVGHSMGTTVAFVIMSEGKFANVKSAVLLSPIAYQSHTSSMFVKLGSSSFPTIFGSADGGIEFNPKGPTEKTFLKNICAQMDCSDMMAVGSGKDCCLDKAVIGDYVDNDLQSSSTKNLNHYGQNIQTGYFAKYNYGGYLNMKKYGTIIPPAYDLSKIAHDFPLMLSYGGKDALSNTKDVSILLDVLKDHNRDKLKVVFVQQYAHIDFIIAGNANDLVYSHILDFFRKYN